MEETGRVDAKYKITKFESPEAYEKGEPDEVSEFQENVFLDDGIDQILKLAVGYGVTNYGSSNAYVGVGDGTLAATASQTGLQGGNTAFAAMMSGYPTVNSGSATFKSEFGTNDANFDWEEFTVVNASSDTGENWNRKVSSQGTKAAGSTWQIEVTLSIT